MQYAENGRQDLDEALFAADDRRRGARGDNVSPETIAEEMELFHSFSAQNSQLSQGVK